MKSVLFLFIFILSMNLQAAEIPINTSSLSYQELQKLKADNPVDSAYFGHSVAIDGDTAVISAYGEKIAYIYKYDELSKQFLQTATLTSSNMNIGDNFGYSVAISGDIVVIGADGDNETNTSSGAVYIYEKPTSGWVNTNTETAKLKAYDSDSYDHFGKSVAISGDTVVIGAPNDDETNNDSGAAYIFEKTLSGWIEMAKLKASDVGGGDTLGYSVAISGDTVVVGAVWDNDIFTDSGSAYIFEKTLSGWIEMAKLKSSNPNSDDWFGNSVAISGDTVVIGVRFDNEISTDSGAAYIYEKPTSGWENTDTETVKLKASDADSGDLFGHSVAISGNTVLIGAYSDNETNTDSGAAYIFKKTLLGWREMVKLKASDADSYDYFGQSVAISGDTVIVGAHKDDDNTSTDSGAVYIFKEKNIFNPAIIMYLLQ